MNNLRTYLATLFILMAFTLSSCELVGDVLEVGAWMGAIVVIIIVLLVLWIVRKFKR